MIALKVDIGILMPITATAESGIDLGVTKTQASRIAPLTIDDILTDISYREPNSSKRMFPLPWEGDE